MVSSTEVRIAAILRCPGRLQGSRTKPVLKIEEPARSLRLFALTPSGEKPATRPVELDFLSRRATQVAGFKIPNPDEQPGRVLSRRETPPPGGPSGADAE